LAGYPGDGERRVWPDRDPGDSTTVESLSWAAADRPLVSLVTVIGGGHTIPHTRYRLPPILGRTSSEFDAAELIWAFFSSGYLPSR
jgi:polyhydroxybutyrate depolymerase